MDPRSHRRPRLAATVAFLLAAVLFAALFLAFPVLYDTDSYYHLGIARLYFERGQLDDLPWARFSLMAEGFGDKEVLFHWLLAPFAGLLGTTGGRLALALLVAGVVAMLAHAATRALGAWGLLLPVLVCLGSHDVLSRLIRLRPELLSLLLLLIAFELAAGRRYRLLGALAFVYTLAYTAFHALLALCLAWFVQQGWGRGRWEWPLLLYPTLGAGAGLLAHPNFPHNLVIWKVQSIDFFRLRHQLDVGAEIGPTQTDALLWSNLGWLAGLALLWWLSRPRPAPPEPARPTDGEHARRDLATVAAVAFAVLYLLGRRFALYAIPFLSLAVVLHLERGFPPPPRRRALRLAGLGLVLALVLLPAGRVLYGLASARGPLDREADWAATGAAIPPGAQVAADWGLGQLFVYFAPHATYLNVLDPVFMAVPYPEAHAATRELFDARAADVPLLLVSELFSDHLLLSRFHRPPALLARLAGDPRLALAHDGLTLLYRVVPGRNGDFVLDWRVIPPPGNGAPSAPSASRTYPRLSGPGGAFEGFVDLDRLAASDLDADGCATLVTEELPARPARYELVPWGPTELRSGGRLVAALTGPLYAMLGRGVELSLGAHGVAGSGGADGSGGVAVEVRTCRDADSGRGGFYLRRLPAR